MTLAAGLAAAGCVPVPQSEMPEFRPAPVTPVGIFPGLDPGAKQVTGLHFQVHAYGSRNADLALDIAEEQYNRIMLETNLYSFKPPGLYSIVVYSSKDEYRKKTRQPEWSDGAAVGNAIYSYDAPQLPAVLAHEMTHLVFHEYMRGARADLRWLNEGLAVHQESLAADAILRRASPAAPSSGLSGEERRALRETPIPFDQMAALMPATERERSVNLWYRQAGDVVRFMLERGGRNGFSAFLSALRDGRDIEEALRASFPGVWGSMADLEAAWRRSL